MSAFSRDDRSMRERMDAGEMYLADDPELIEAYAAQAVLHDATIGRYHAYSSGPNGPVGVSWAENEALRWPLTGSVQSVVAAMLRAFWSEGPGGGHYENMRQPSMRSVGCGVYLSGRELSLTQHFRG